MVQSKILNNIFNVDEKELKAKIELIKHRLESLISSKEFSAVAIEELEKTNFEVNKILSRANSTGVADYQATAAKSQNLYAAGKLLLNFSRKYQEVYEQELLEQIRFAAQQLEGFGKYYEIHSLVKSKPAAEASNEELLKLTILLIDFTENHWETNSEDVAELGMYAQQLVKLREDNGQLTMKEWLSQPKFNRVVELNYIWLKEGLKFSEESYVAYMRSQEQFIESALSALEKIKNKKIEENVEDTITLMDSWHHKYKEEEMYETSLLLEERFGF